MHDGPLADGPSPGQRQIVHQLASRRDHRVVLANVLQRRQRNGGEQPDDDEDNNELDEREATRPGLAAATALVVREEAHD